MYLFLIYLKLLNTHATALFGMIPRAANTHETRCSVFTASLPWPIVLFLQPCFSLPPPKNEKLLGNKIP
jgi:hypothetical protein